MSNEKQKYVNIEGTTIHVKGEKDEEITVGPGGIHVKDNDSEVKVSWTGIRVRDGKTNVNVSVWKPLLGCGFGLIVLLAIITAVIVGIIKLLI